MSRFNNEDLKQSTVSVEDGASKRWLAVPINPEGNQNTDALLRVCQVYEENLNTLTAQDKTPRASLVDLVEIATFSTVVRRLQSNYDRSVPLDCPQNDVNLYSKACLGQAVVPELIELMQHHPYSLKALEIAETTLAYEWGDSDQTSALIIGLIEKSGFDTFDTQSTRYSYMRSDDQKSPTAGFFVRKCIVGTLPIDEGELVAVQRDSFVIDMEHADSNNLVDGEDISVSEELRAWIKDSNTQAEMGNRANDWKLSYPHLVFSKFANAEFQKSADERSAALLPAARSFYVKFVPAA